MKKQLLLLFVLLWGGLIQAQQLYPLKGKIISKNGGLPVPGANIIVKGTLTGTVSDDMGFFELRLPEGNHLLKISFIGFVSGETEVRIPEMQLFNISLEEEEVSLQEFQVVSTGFQELSPERTTGSFAQIGNDLFNRRVSTNVLDRISDVTPGLQVVNDGFSANAQPQILIRGSSTILAESAPLIVVDNMTYDGPLSSINPNDVESITVLKDAAAASIWGARAGNGVIVVTTKRGKTGQSLKVSFNANATWGQQPDLYYQPQMSISSFVDQEVKLFDRGFYNGQVDSYLKSRLSPVVETLLQFRQGEITLQEKDQALLGFKQQDVRGDLEDYFYRPSLSQQYSLGISGGSQFYSYSFSAGWDDNRSSRMTDQNSRLTLSSRQDWKGAGNKLKVGVGTYWTLARSESAVPDIGNFFAYDRLTDEQGTPLPVYRSYSNRFKSSVMDMGLLNWDYYPLDEIGLSPRNTQGNEMRVNADLSYQLLPGLSATAFYQYWNSDSQSAFLQPLESYYAREQVNVFSYLDSGGALVRPLPVGGILDETRENAYSHNLRTQLNWDNVFNSVHEVHVLGGFELKDLQAKGSNGRSYGYNADLGISQPVDYIGNYIQLPSGFAGKIPFLDGFKGTVNRYLSAFANAGYSFQNRYLVNASARVDKSNLFGVNTNQKTVPLWSAGLGWIASEEKFLDVDWISFLKLRATYGYNGNTNPNATAYTTASYFGAGSNSVVGKPFLGVLTPPNPELRWERIKILNLGLDFELWKGRWSGSAEVYSKTGLDLMGSTPLFPSSGFYSAVLNYASTQTNGMDLNLSYRVSRAGLQWTSSFFYSLIRERVTDFENTPTATQIMNSQPGAEVPVKGKPLHHLFSYPWAGLNPDTGAPMGWIEGTASEDYNALIQLAEEQLVYHGSSRPTNFGAWRNQLDWKDWSLSVNLTYRLGYYFRDLSVDYDNINRGIITHSDFDSRWQQPGDQSGIPADPEMVDPSRNVFYLKSSALVEKGDHVRIQDIRLSRQITISKFSQFQVYAYANNLGILWKASDRVKDPDNRLRPLPKTLALGIQMAF